jgi:hypothetical protein
MSSSSSKNTTASTNQSSQSTINTVDNRQAGDNATVGGNITVNSGEASQVKIEATDLGAIKGGLDIALESLRGIQAATGGAVAAVQSTASDSISQAYGLANEARQSETSGAINSLTKYLFWIALAGVAAFVLVRSKHS